MSSLLNVLKIRQLLQPSFLNRHVPVRQLFHPTVLGLRRFQLEKDTIEKTLGSNREMFFKQMKETVDTEKAIFTKDFRALILLAETEEEIKLTFSARNVYKKQQKESLFPGTFKHAEAILQMLYINKQEDTAFRWFQDERSTIVHDAANVPCFVLMMDMLHRAKKYDDVISLMANVDVYMNRPHLAIVVAYFAALYKKNTPTSLSQAVSRLQDCCEKEIPLPRRCLFYTTLLAYKQGDVRSMMEILELPIFYLSRIQHFNIADNIKLLAYIELGRLDECVAALKGLLMNMTTAKEVVFKDVIAKLSKAIEEKGKVELKVEFETVRRALERADVMTKIDSDQYMERDIRTEELKRYEHLYSPRNLMSTKGFQLVGDQSERI